MLFHSYWIDVQDAVMLMMDWQKKTKKTGADPFDPGSFGILWISFKNVNIRNTIRVSGKAV